MTLGGRHYCIDIWNSRPAELSISCRAQLCSHSNLDLYNIELQTSEVTTVASRYSWGMMLINCPELFLYMYFFSWSCSRMDVIHLHMFFILVACCNLWYLLLVVENSTVHSGRLLLSNGSGFMLPQLKLFEGWGGIREFWQCFWTCFIFFSSLNVFLFRKTKIIAIFSFPQEWLESLLPSRLLYTWWNAML